MSTKTTQHEGDLSTDSKVDAPAVRRPKSRVISSTLVVRTGVKGGLPKAGPPPVLIDINQG